MVEKISRLLMVMSIVMQVMVCIIKMEIDSIGNENVYLAGVIPIGVIKVRSLLS